MVLAEKVSEQVVTMTAPEMIVEAAGGLSEIHHSLGLCNVLAII
jgi:hypothetical protein